MADAIVFSGVFVDIVNRQRASQSLDFAYGEYLATNHFFEEISRLQEQVIRNEKFTLSTGQEIDPQTTGGMLAINIFMEALDSRRLAAVGLSKAGLNVEKTMWKNL
jgi:hypothetical protein